MSTLHPGQTGRNASGHDVPSWRNRFLKRSSVAERLGISPWALRRMWERGEGPPRRQISPRFDGCTEGDLADYFEACKVT
jgi:hypothetical protein